MAKLGIGVSYETAQRWCGKFGRSYVDCLCRRRGLLSKSGISMRRSSRTRAFRMICGVPRTRTVSS